MTEPRPLSVLDWGGVSVEPSGGQKSAGFFAGDRPPAQWANWELQTIDGWLKYLDQNQGNERRAVDALLNWSANQAYGASVNLVKFAYGAGLIIGVGDAGKIYSSADGGRTWASRTAGSSYASSFRDILFSQTLNGWIAVGFDGEIQTAAAAGVTWTRRQTGGGHLHAVAEDFAGHYVAVGAQANALVSTGATSWTTGGALPGTPYTQLVYASGHFVAGGDTAAVATSLATSVSGASWAAINIGLETIESLTTDVAHVTIVADGRLTSASSTSGRKIYSSSNGTSFTARLTYTGDALNLPSVIYTGAGFVHMYLGASHQFLRTSFDGVTWNTVCTNVFSLAFLSASNSLASVVDMDGARVAFFGNGTTGYFRSNVWSYAT